MYVSVYLHKDIVNIMKCYGTLSEVTDRILALADSGEIDLWDKPTPPSREGAGRYDILVTNESYITMLNNNPFNTPRLSLRRIIYWFIENELYNEFGWEIVNPYVDEVKLKQIKKLKQVRDIIERLRTNQDLQNGCDEILRIVKDLDEVLKNG